MSVAVIIPTFGEDPIWKQRAKQAAKSAEQWGVLDVFVSHAANLAKARNTPVDRTSAEWLCFLDADDELAPDYFTAMLNAQGDIRRPSTLGVYEDGAEDDHPVMIPRRNIYTSNFIIIGALVRREDFLAVGGFDPELPCLEDWDLWIRLIKAGAELVDVPEAVYRVTVRPNSRNSDQGLHDRTYNKIRKRYQ